jgi:hypothetical protein
MRDWMCLTIACLVGVLLAACAQASSHDAAQAPRVAAGQPHWECRAADNRGVCHVTFDLMNRTDRELQSQVRIHADHSTRGQVCGQLRFSIKLAPMETYTVQRKFSVTCRPDRLTVQARE